MDDQLNQAGEGAVSTREYQPWHPPEGSIARESDDSATVSIQKEDIVSVQEIILSAIKPYFSKPYLMSLQPEFRKETETKPLSQAIEQRAGGDYLYEFLKQSNRVALLYFSQKMTTELLELTYGLTKEFEVKPVEKTTLGDFDSYTIYSIGSELLAPLSDVLYLSDHQSTRDKPEDTLTCYLFEIQFKEKPDDQVIRFILSESLITEYLINKNNRKDNQKKVDLNQTDIEIEARILQSKVTLSYVLGLSEGDLIPISSKDNIDLSIRGKHYMKGLLGTIGHKKGVKIS